MKEDYVYAVARIRSKENDLLTLADVERLITSDSEEECLRVLSEKGWEVENDPDAMLSTELMKTWELLRELTAGSDVLDLFLYKADFNNLKAAIKAVSSGDTHMPLTEKGTVPSALIREAVMKQDFSLLPEALAQPGEEAMKTLLHTGDGQLCDIMLDAAAMSAILRAGKESGSELLNDYAQWSVAIADIKIAVRGCRVGKDADFYRTALVSCETISADSLAAAARKGMEELLSYLTSVGYADAADALEESFASFEQWCDNTLMKLMKSQRYEAFSVGPLAAYAMARETEIRTVRLILACKRNGFAESVIRERLRDLYV